MVVDSANAPRAIVRTTRVEVRPFRDVDARFAWDEGEDDRTLESWRAGHIAFFEREAAAEGFTFHEDLPVVLERFTVVWPPEVADPG